jgi:hypothetical protein
MILQTNENNVINTMDGYSAEFEIESSSKMFDILSSKIYSDPIRAIIRELSCNAIDAHLDIDNKNPIIVYLPTINDPTLIIKDNGIGMTHEDVTTVYKSYGKSTKSSSNKLIGALGLGGKTPLAYTSQFTLTTSRDGTKNHYVIFRNENGIPEVTLINSEPSDETGTEVSLTVKGADITDFYRAAYSTFIFFNQIPIIKRGKNEFFKLFSSSEEIFRSLHDKLLGIQNYATPDELEYEDNLLLRIVDQYSTHYGIIMGQVFYSVDKERLYESEYVGEFTEEAFRFPCSNEYRFIKIIRMEPGSVSFQPSREALNYSVNTKKSLIQSFAKDFVDYSQMILDFKDSQDYLNNIEKINFSYNDRLIKVVRENTKNTILNALFTAYSDAINHFFQSSKLGQTFLFYTNQRTHKYMVQELFSKDFQSRDILFKKLILQKYEALLELDDPEHCVKILEKWTDKPASRNYLGLSSFTAKYLEEMPNNILVAPSFSQYFKDNIGIPCFSISDLIKQYNQINKLPVGAKQRKSSGTRNTDGKCWDNATKREITVQELFDLLKIGEVTYELFEGAYENRGYYYEPNFTSIGPKNSSLENIDNRDWITSRRIPRSTDPKYQISLPKHHIFADYTFFKKNEFWNLKNLYFYKDFFLKELITVFTNIRNDIKKPMVYNNHLFQNCLNTNLVKIGINKYGSAFENTDFGKDFAALVTERKSKETSFKDMGVIIDDYLKCNLLNRGNHLIPQYNQLAIKIKEYGKQLIADISSTMEKNQPKDYIKPLLEKYFMLKFINPQNLDGNELLRVADYIAMVDGLKPID